MALSYPWGTINDTQCDADSPFDETLAEQIRRNLIHLQEWAYDKDVWSPIENHDHDGTYMPRAADVVYIESATYIASSAIDSGTSVLKSAELIGSGSGCPNHQDHREERLYLFTAWEDGSSPPKGDCSKEYTKIFYTINPYGDCARQWVCGIKLYNPGPQKTDGFRFRSYRLKASGWIT